MELWNLDYFEDTKDIIVLVNGKEYEINSYIVIVSEILREIFKGTRFSEGKNNVKEIDDVRTDTWELFLNLIYSIYIKNYLEYVTDEKIKTIELKDIDTYDLLELIIFSDKILANKIVNIVSDFVRKNILGNIFENIFSNSINNELYNLYEDILSVIDVFPLFKNIYCIKHPKYFTNTKKFSFDIDKLSQFPHLLYLVLVFLSQYKMNNEYYSASITIEYHNDISHFDSRLYEQGVNNVLKWLNIKPPSKLISIDYINNLENSIIYILKYILSDIVQQNHYNLKILADENWRIKGDDIVHELISNY